MSSKATTIIATTALAAGSFFLLSTLFQNKSNNYNVSDIDDDDDDDKYITPDIVCKFFDALFVQMNAVLSNLSQQIAQIQAAGQRIPEDQLQQLLSAEFERALLVKQQQALDEMDIDEDCMKEATEAFLAKGDTYAAVVRSVDRFRKLYENVTGSSTSGDGNENVEILSAKDVVEAAGVYFDGLTEAMKKLVDQFKAEGMDVGDSAVSQKLQMKFAAIANEAGEEALKKIGLTDKSFKRSLEKHASTPDVGRALAMLQMKQQQEMIAMGINPGM